MPSVSMTGSFGARPVPLRCYIPIPDVWIFIPMCIWRSPLPPLMPSAGCGVPGRRRKSLTSSITRRWPRCFGQKCLMRSPRQDWHCQSTIPKIGSWTASTSAMATRRWSISVVTFIGVCFRRRILWPVAMARSAFTIKTARQKSARCAPWTARISFGCSYNMFCRRDFDAPVTSAFCIPTANG